MTAKKILHQFIDTGSFFIETFQSETIIVMTNNLCYTWWCNASKLKIEQQQGNSTRNHRVLSGYWIKIDFDPTVNGETKVLAAKYLVDQKTSPFWSFLLIVTHQTTRLIYHYTVRRNDVKKDKIKTKKYIAIEVEESNSNQTNHVAVYSPCGRLCVIGLNYSTKRSEICLMHIVDQNIFTQRLSTELEFLSENETIKCVDFTTEGIL